MSIRSHPIDPDSLSLEITIRLPTCVRICVLVELEQVFVSDSYFCQLLSYVISLGVRWQWRSVFRRRSRTATCKGVHRWTRPKDESQSFREAAPFVRIWRTATDAICPTSRGWHLRAENAPRLEHHPPPLFLLCCNRAIVTNGFVKKTQRTPRKEIERAKKFREIWRSHNDRL